MSNNHSNHEAHPTVYAFKEHLKFKGKIKADELRSRIDVFLCELTESLKHGGCTLIGHIKGLVDAGENGHLVFSITSFDENARFKGEVRNEVTNAVITVNIVVYGISEDIVEKELLKVFTRNFQDDN